MSQPDDIPALIEAVRQKIGLTQVELGAALDVSANTIARWERGERTVSHPGMLRLALEALSRRRRKPAQ